MRPASPMSMAMAPKQGCPSRTPAGGLQAEVGPAAPIFEPALVGLCGGRGGPVGQCDESIASSPVDLAQGQHVFTSLGRYYATESMLVLDSSTARYDAAATPETGTETLFDFYARLPRGEAAPERGDHAVF